MVEQLEFYASTGTARFYNDESRANEAPALPASGGILARASAWIPTRLPAQLSCSAEVRSGEGFSPEQQLDNSFFSCQSFGIRSVSGAHLRKYANVLVLFLLVSVLFL